MEQNKLLNKPFKQTFHIIDIKLKIVISKFIPTINILISKIHLKDKYIRMKNTSLTFYQRLNKTPPFYSNFTLLTTKNENSYQDMCTFSQKTKSTNTT